MRVQNGRVYADNDEQAAMAVWDKHPGASSVRIWQWHEGIYHYLARYES